MDPSLHVREDHRFARVHVPGDSVDEGRPFGSALWDEPGLEPGESPEGPAEGIPVGSDWDAEADDDFLRMLEEWRLLPLGALTERH